MFGRPKQPRDKFDQMFSYFKYLVTITITAILIIVGAGTWFLGSSMKDVRDNAERTTNAEVLKAVERAFKTENIQETINKVAEREIRGAIQIEISKQLEKTRPTQMDIVTASLLYDAMTRMRQFNSSGLTDILNILNDPKVDSLIKDAAKKFLRSFAKDFERWPPPPAAPVLISPPRGSVVNPSGGLTVSPTDSLVNIILDDKNLLNRIQAIHSLRKMTGIQFGPIDIDAVKRWAGKNQKTDAK